MMNWLRTNLVASVLLTLVRIYVGWKFLDAGWGKLTGDKAFDATGFLKGAIEKSHGDKPVVQDWYGSFLDSFALPNVGLFNFLVQWGEFLVGLGLIIGTFTTFAALMGLLMNFNYVLAGTVSINANLIFLGFFIVAAGANAGKIGGDYFVLPFLRAKLFKSRDGQKNPGVGLQG